MLSISWQALLSIWENVRSYLVSPLLSCHYPSGFSVQPAGESEQRHFRSILITGLVISPSLYIYKHLPHTVKQASLFIGKNTLPILLFSPVFTALSKLFLPFFSFDPTGICFLCTATVITLYGSIFIAFCLDKARLSPFFFGKKITHIENRHFNRTYITATHDGITQEAEM